MYRKTGANYRDDGGEMVGPEEATPWHEMKAQAKETRVRNVEEISDEEESVYIRNAERQKVMKQRDETYRKFLIEESKREESKWDSFSENDGEKEEEEDDEDQDEQEDEEEVEAVKEPKKDRKRKVEQVDEEPEESPEAEEDDEEEEAAEEEVEEEKPVAKVKAPKFKKAKVEPTPLPPKKKLKKKKGEQKKNGQDEELNSTTESSTSLVESPFPVNNTLMCLGCREKGHRLKHCPKFKTTVCIKCGSTEHKYKECSVQGKEFKFATCFVCKETVSY